MKILGLAGSIRNKIDGNLRFQLIRDLQRIPDKETLHQYLQINSQLPPEDQVINHSKPLNKDLLEIYLALKKRKIKKGMCNSEVALSAALWAAYRNGAEVDYISLRDHFLPSTKINNIELLRDNLKASDALLISGPVYFGDRSSIVQELITFIRRDEELRQEMAGKLYGGIAVGAKRNGGQETTLIYQILDMISLGMLAVGNDHETTSQYGGTCHAGNVGTLCNDNYGLDTAMGTGRRLGSLLNNLKFQDALSGKLKILFLVLQDSGDLAYNLISEIAQNFHSSIDAEIINLSKSSFIRCLACDVCPEKIDLDETYRCKIGNADDFSKLHPKFLDHDAIIPVAASVNDFSSVYTNYQIFMERTRYLRRGDYVWSNLMVSPLIFQEVGSVENLSIRMITSMVRHHTIISKPILGHILNGNLLNKEQVINDLKVLLPSIEKYTVSRLASFYHNNCLTQYNPVGYVLDTEKYKEDEHLRKRKEFVKNRRERIMQNAVTRLVGQNCDAK